MVFLLDGPESIVLMNNVFTQRAESLKCLQHLLKFLVITFYCSFKRLIYVSGFFASVAKHDADLKSDFSLASVLARYHLSCSSKSLQFWAVLPVKDSGFGGLHRPAISRYRIHFLTPCYIHTFSTTELID